MLVAAFFRWWYGAGWLFAYQRLIARLQSLARVFSITLLLRTLFSPWRRVIAVRGRGLDAAIHATIDNAVGRLIGFSVRCIVLTAAAVSMSVLAIFGGVLLIVWPLLPPLALVLIIVGVVR